MRGHDKPTALPEEVIQRSARKLAAGAADGSSPVRDGASSARSAAPRGSGQKYKYLVAEALQLTAVATRTLDKMRQAEDKLRAAIDLCPERRDAHGILAQLVVVRDHNASISHYMRTVELSMLRDELWAKAAITVFEHFQTGWNRGEHGSGLTRPSWWNDETLRAFAVDARGLLPDYEFRAVRMHALVLSAPLYPWRTWEASSRTSEELIAAAGSYQQLVKLVSLAKKGAFPVALGPEDRILLTLTDNEMKTYIQLALQCRRLASAPDEESRQALISAANAGRLPGVDLFGEEALEEQGGGLERGERPAEEALGLGALKIS